ncbi:uncharacterized protein LOC120705470 isoform X2 [Panicum virgatum]|uniref:Uncharacterized protein n=1 Tax=Panicum virgatum TaxID=38727 RepID=A0A8T0S7M1_PANVG|nr:uncharacterized protein LOC120705470 isoform X2 [Panicum virgatum]XP_039845738.1 uncharacterized protein LOC120705470 isoform X2 [Panicum virgatum]KAG2594599.1 hypothetical protein PVAP13_5KG005600 [Panicum virgatum]KAG2594601.1 hypothetical protein PVAP13_5KG005600 [Panicum virgatum]
MAAATVWLLQRPSPALHNSLSLPSSQHPSSSASPPLHKKPKDLLLCCASSGASSSVVAKEQEEAATAPPEEGSESPLLSYKDDPNFRGCRGCGRDELERGCNGEGRIQGGIAAVPGFGWWPIKAYRPCPGFVASGGRYRRQGQSMDDVASGRGKKISPPKKKM